MRARQRTTISLEAIKFQTNKRLEKDLVGYLTMMRNANIDQVDAFTTCSKELMKSIFFHLKMPVEFKVIEDAPSDYLIAVTPPFFTEKHPLVMGPMSNMTNDKLRMGVLKDLLDSPDKMLSFGVDFETGKLSGLASQIPSTIYIGTSVLRDGNVTAEWIANALIHELGHIDTLYLSLRYATSSSWAIRFALEALDGTQDRNEFVATVQQIGSSIGAEDVSRMKDLDQRVQKEMVTAIIMDKFRERTRSEIGTNLADKTSTEALADQFLVRFGNPLAFAQFMDYVTKQGKPAQTASTVMELALRGTVAAVATIIAGPVVAAAGTILGVMLSMYWSGSTEALNTAYDRPYERTLRMRRELVAAVKETDDPKVRASIVQQVAALDSILPELKKHEPMMVKVLPLFSSSLRNLRKEQNLVRSLEELFNNPLFLRHVQLSQINEIEG